ncbi:MAG: protein-glutamate methylesterase/protein-glutamine glutaminase [Pseudolabrys sp.]
MTALAATTQPDAAARKRLRVMIVDDAAVVRGLIARWVTAEPDLDVVALVRTGRDALDEIDRADPDVVVLDVEMPELDGISAVPLLLATKRDLVVIMASTVTRRNAEISLKALSLGAADYVPKPSTPHDAGSSDNFRRELIEKIRALGPRARRPRLAATAHLPRPVRPHQPVVLRPMPLTPPRVLLIGSSTGGPQALDAVLSHASALISRAPVLITQHMPPTFTAILAEHLSRSVKAPVREAVDGEPVVAGTVYIAPGGHHMRVATRDGATVIAIDDGPHINFCKPSVDPLFSSAATIWGSKALALVLTGMGADGLSGAKDLVAAGGHVIAQDEATSVVWGMPGQVAHAGLCSAVLPLPEIGSRLTRMFTGERA